LGYIIIHGGTVPLAGGLKTTSIMTVDPLGTMHACVCVWVGGGGEHAKQCRIIALACLKSVQLPSHIASMQFFLQLHVDRENTTVADAAAPDAAV